ncbi:hypothetical protein NPIL_560521 [Nephila pilipes]|uniref:Uncharacterized protein n=1 Tax=Nephila pilipes TaxID=299642 RepID=A0A8X6N435_NEPPI|nr:hypothetical protein NPIL_560521 [Nephila pilipes]
MKKTGSGEKLGIEICCPLRQRTPTRYRMTPESDRLSSEAVFLYYGHGPSPSTHHRELLSTPLSLQMMLITWYEYTKPHSIRLRSTSLLCVHHLP